MLHLALALEEVAASVELQVVPARAHFFAEFLGFVLVLSLQPEDLLLVAAEPLLLLRHLTLLLRNGRVELLDLESESAQSFLLVEFLLPQLFDFALEALVDCEHVVVGIDGLVELPFQDLHLALLFEGFGLKLLALEGVEFLGLLRVFLDDLAAVLLQPEEPALVLLQHARVIVDLPLEELVGALVEEAVSGGGPVEDAALLHLSASASVHLLLL